MNLDHRDPELEDLLSDIHRLIDDDAAAEAAQDPVSEDFDDEFDIDGLLEGQPLPESDPEERLDLSELFAEELGEEAMPEPVPEPEKPQRWTDRQKAPKHVEKLQKNQQQAYADWLYEQENNPTQAAAAMVRQDIQNTRWTDRQKVPRHVAKLQKNQQQAYADWLYEQDSRTPAPPPETEEEQPKKQKKKKKQRPQSDETPILPQTPKKKRRGLRNFLIFLVTVTLLMAAAAVFLLPRQPRTDLPMAQRKEGVSTVLLMGTDAGGARTDTMMLLTADRSAGQLSLVSIPRDTLVQGSYTVPKLNSVYAANNGGQEGIDMVLTRVEQCIGFRPDGYVLVQLEAFVDFVDAMGGVRFDVPVDMYYDDASQDLHIALDKGLQTLSGEEAMGLVRFRSGYADADLGRVQVQRDFLAALMEQIVSVRGVAVSPMLLNILQTSTQTDLTAGELLWLAQTVLLSDLQDIQSATLPGSDRMIGDGSYYVLDPQLVAQTVNAYCNPYDREITAADLDIRTE